MPQFFHGPMPSEPTMDERQQRIQKALAVFLQRAKMKAVSGAPKRRLVEEGRVTGFERALELVAASPVERLAKVLQKALIAAEVAERGLRGTISPESFRAQGEVEALDQALEAATYIVPLRLRVASTRCARACEGCECSGECDKSATCGRCPTAGKCGRTSDDCGCDEL